jgi:aminoglycoside N3'-acetyltransferase
MDFLKILFRFISESSDKLELDVPRNLFIQSDMGYLLKKLKGSENFSLQNFNLLQSLKEMFQNYVDDSGALLFPGFFDEYSKNNTSFDIKVSLPSKHIGAFPRFIFKSEETYREHNPLTNIMVVGRNKENFTKNVVNSITGYAENSVWSNFVKHSVGNLLIGISPTYLTYLHFLEVQARAPYIFNKYFYGPVLDSGFRISDFSICPVRFRDSKIQWSFGEFIRTCHEKKAIYFLPGSNGLVSLASPQRLKNLFEERFSLNPFFLLKTSVSEYRKIQDRFESSLDMVAPNNDHSVILS